MAGEMSNGTMIQSCVILGKDKAFCRTVKRYLTKITDVSLVREWNEIAEAREFIFAYNPDIIISIVDSAEPNAGVDELIRSQSYNCFHILITDNENSALSALQAMGLENVDCVLLPVTLSRFKLAIKRALEFLACEKALITPPPIDNNFRNVEIQIETGTKRILLDIRTIVYMQGFKCYTIIHTAEGNYVVRKTIRSFEDFLAGKNFMRVHRSFIVAVDRIKIAHRDRIDLGMVSIPIGPLYREQINVFLNIHPTVNGSFEKKKVGIVIEDASLRKTYEEIINSSPDFCVAGSFCSAEEVYKSLARNNGAKIILMDAVLQGTSGIEVTQKIKRKYQDITIIMVSAFEQSDIVFSTLRAGASGYLLKDSGQHQILSAIREIAKGGAPLSSRIAKMVIESFHSNPRSPLSRRETQVLQNVALGKTFSTVAKQLLIARETAKVHIRNIYRKLDVNSRAGAIEKATRERFI